MVFGGGKKVLALADAHYTKVTECYANFCAFLSAYFEAEKSDHMHSCYETLDRLEREADELRSEVVETLLSGALLPVTRKEILDICAQVDKIANRAQDTARQIVIERVRLPQELRDGLIQIVNHTCEQLGVLTRIIEMLFSNYDKLVKDHSLICEIRTLESKIDKIENTLIEEAFCMDMGLAEKNQCRYFIRHIANVSDHIENIADDIQIMMVYRKV